MTVIAIIPARANSQSIKNKNIVNLNNKPLITYTFEAARRSKLIDYIYVSTDSTKVIKLAKKFNIESILRPKQISGNLSKTHDAITHVLKKIDNKILPTLVVILQPTSPLRKATHIDQAIKKMLQNKKADSLVSCIKSPHIFNPESLMILQKNGFLKCKKKLIRRQDKKIFYARNGAAIYITRYPLIKKQILGNFLIPFFMNLNESIDIDTIDDLKLAEKLLQ
jgi:CMP-N-acetylneuraminic acid synthetase